MRLWLLAVGAAVLVFVGFAPSARAFTWFGFNDGSSLQPSSSPFFDSPMDDAQLVGDAGSNIIRMDLSWYYIESASAPGQYNWGQWDNVYPAMIAKGIKPLFILDTTPSGYADSTFGTNSIWVPPTTANLPAWSAFVTAAADHFRQAAGFEVWNEENTTAFGNHQDPARYVAMLQAAYSAVKNEDIKNQIAPRPVIVGGLTGCTTPSSSTFTSIKDFATYVYNNAGADFDGFGIHPYPVSSDPSVCFNPAMSAVRSARPTGDTRPLWITELGFTTGPAGPASNHFSDSGQAGALDQFYKLASGMSDVAAFVIHTTLDGPNASTVSDQGFGLVRRGLVRTFKPAYCTIEADRGMPQNQTCIPMTLN